VNVVQHAFADGAGHITLNRPERMNAVTTELARQLEDALRELSADPAVNVIVIRGAGKNFCAGGDVAEVERLRSAGPESLRTLFDAFRRACDAILTVDVPVVAAVEGAAMAGGFELMQAADIVIVSDDAKIADSHINFGMIPGGGSTQRLPRLVGRQIALGLLLSGDCLSGLHDFDAGVHHFVAKLARRDRSAVTTIKKLVGGTHQQPLAQGLDDEIDAVVAHITDHGVGEFRKVGATA
jgi:enoyl-CoA hydratase/carnithine racemase